MFVARICFAPSGLGKMIRNSKVTWQLAKYDMRVYYDM